MRRLLAGLVVMVAMGAMGGVSLTRVGVTRPTNGQFIYHKPPPPQTSITAATCNRNDVSTAIDAATLVGTTIVIPAGSCTWTSPLTVTKPVALAGAGGGGYVGRSTSSVAVGTGTKVFTTASGLSFVNGETLTARYPNLNGVSFMTGTVSSYIGTTLTMNIASVGTAATRDWWVFERPPLTTITNSAVSNTGDGMLLITESLTGSIAVSGIAFTVGTGTLGEHIKIHDGGALAYPVLIHDNWFQQTGSMNEGVGQDVNRGIIYRNSFGATLCAAAFLGCTPVPNGALGMASDTNSFYNHVSTQGALDTTGTANIYYEDNYFLVMWQALSGFDDGARVVFRHNIVDNATVGSHGAETSPLGVRQWELYDNTFYYNNVNPGACEAYNLNSFFLIRGGTGVMTDNTIADINSGGGCYGDKPEIVIQVQNLRRNTALNGCWGANIAGIQYPAPRQFGFGYVGGSAGNDAGGRYLGDSEPAYFWNNSGSSTILISEYSPDECVNSDSITDYVQLNRDYFTTAKSGYVKYAYPHPLRVP